MKFRIGLLILIIAFVPFLIVATACKTFRKLTQFSLKYQTQIIIPSTVGVNLPFNFITPPINTNTVSEFERHNTHKSLVEQVQLKSLQLKLVSPTNSDFSFLNAVRIFISADDLAEIQVAWRENILNQVGKTLDLQTSNANLKDYLTKEKIKLRVNTVTDKLITSEHRIDVDALFLVDAKILGL